MNSKPLGKFHEYFEPDLLKELNQCQVVDISSNTTILNTGTYIKEVPLLIEGNIKVKKTDDSGKEILLYHINAGESCILSITSTLNNKVSHADAITESDSKMILVRAAQVREWTDKYSSWRRFLMRLYYNRLAELMTLVDSIAFRHIDERLAEKLLEKADSKTGVVTITHQQLANELGTAREVISRLLKQLEKNRKITISRGKIKIIDKL